MSELHGQVDRVSRRIRLVRALHATVLLSLAGFALAALVVAAAKLQLSPWHELPRQGSNIWLGVAAALPFLGGLIGLLRPVSKLRAAALIDRTHNLHSRVANALEFQALPESERSPFMIASLRDAIRHAPHIHPQRAMPLTIPRGLGASVGGFMGLVAVLLLEVPQVEPQRAHATFTPLRVDAEDLEPFAAKVQKLEMSPETPEEVRAAVRAFNKILEDLAAQRLTRSEAIRRVAALDRRLAEGRTMDVEALEQSLRDLGRNLERSKLTEPASEALQQSKLSAAARKLEELAKKLKQDPPSRAELDRLRKALRKASKQTSRPQTKSLDRARERVNRLLKRRQKQKLAARERRLLKQRRRELERLQRSEQQRAEQRRQLQRLRRELQRSAASLNQQNPSGAADALERGAEDLNRMARDQLSEQQRQNLARQLRQLREMIRRQRGNQGQSQGKQGGRSARMKRFRLSAKGRGSRLLMPGQGQGNQRQGNQGQGNQGQGGRPGQSQGPGQGTKQGGREPGSVLKLGGQGRGNAMLELPGGQMPGGQTANNGGRGSSLAPGGGAGTEHDPSMLGKPTNLPTQARNTRVEGDEAEGPSTSEVILGAADRGFASKAYRKVHATYDDHAEEVLERDDIPPGYRFYVRRYFQLIRPREAPRTTQPSP